jgi:hypothetical protein
MGVTPQPEASREFVGIPDPPQPGPQPSRHGRRHYDCRLDNSRPCSTSALFEVLPCRQKRRDDVRATLERALVVCHDPLRRLPHPLQRGGIAKERLANPCTRVLFVPHHRVLPAPSPGASPLRHNGRCADRTAPVSPRLPAPRDYARPPARECPRQRPPPRPDTTGPTPRAYPGPTPARPSPAMGACPPVLRRLTVSPFTRIICSTCAARSIWRGARTKRSSGNSGLRIR